MDKKVENEKVKPMVITDPDESREYTLEFNRKTVSRIEQAGLDINQLEAKSMTMIPLLFWGAFLMHHPHMTKDQTDKILFDQLRGLRDNELEHLGKLYAEPFKTLVATSEEGANPRKVAIQFQ